MGKVSIDTRTMIQAIRLAGKIMRYARGGYSDDEKQDLVADLLALGASTRGEPSGRWARTAGGTTPAPWGSACAATSWRRR